MKKYLQLLLIAFIFTACEDEDEPSASCDGTLMLSVSRIDNADCGTASGGISLAASGGTAPYEFRLDGGSYQSASSFNQVEAGVHQLSVRDANNCEVSVEESVLTGLTLDNIRPIILTNCAVSGCHNGDRSNLPDYNRDTEILSRISQIQSRTADKTMPPPGTSTSLTDAEIELISCWADDGGPR